METGQRAPASRKLVERYGGGGFRIAGEGFKGSVLIASTLALAWPPTQLAEVTIESLAPLLAAGVACDLLLLGCGPRLVPPQPSLREALRRRGVVLEAMDTGAACRTFNVLTAEERRVAAALIAV